MSKNKMAFCYDEGRMAARESSGKQIPSPYGDRDANKFAHQWTCGFRYECSVMMDNLTNGKSSDFTPKQPEPTADDIPLDELIRRMENKEVSPDGTYNNIWAVHYEATLKALQELQERQEMDEWIETDGPI